ncbi:MULTISPECIES: hypothetical protein [Microbispora]|uniref:Uncharacterized protein n=1 Tax=Microbispora hainanensis TaxID=568844 RepID=A0ABZ1SII4_9ACTN|nr:MULTISPECIES: hypothetical protein [Microbispora]
MAASRWTRNALRAAVVLGAIGLGCLVVSASVDRKPPELVLPKVAWEGGPAYYKRFPAAAQAGWTDASFFPIGVWFESVVDEKDVVTDKAAGLNTYVELTANSNADLLRRHGMWAITSKPLPGAGRETVGWIIADEADMFAGPGDGKWTGKVTGEGPPCEPEKPPCGYTAMRTLKERLPRGDGRMHYANYGKGVAMWESEAEAERFVNGYTDVMSTDMYWYTDLGMCEEAENFLRLPRDECPVAADYGMLLDKERRLDGKDGKRQPIYAFIEVGWPGSNGVKAIKPEQIRGAVMNSLIHEARGIIYFNHNFGGPCVSQHALRDCSPETRVMVTRVNQQIKQLAPVLNTQSYEFGFCADLDTMLKGHDGSYYVFAMVRRGSKAGRHTLTLPPALAGAGKVEVLFENRTLPISSGGQFTDTFEAEYTSHIYKITP